MPSTSPRRFSPLLAVAALSCIALPVPVVLFATSVPNAFSDGTVASAAAVNANFNALANAVTTLEDGVGFDAMVVIDASGNFVVPAGVTRIHAQVWGGGGGGGGGGASWPGCGGGAGGYAAGIFTVTPGASIPVTIGAFGVGGAAANSAPQNVGSNGGTTSLGTLLSATGGEGSGGNGSCGNYALGGVGTTGQLLERGQSGGMANYGATAAYMTGGNGGFAPHGGAGGQGSHGGSVVNGSNGMTPGGGGAGGGRSGGGFSPGNNGGPGRVLIYY